MTAVIYSRTITVVTAYFNLGTFRKGNEIPRSQEIYKEWMMSFAFLNNAVIVFTDVVEVGSMLSARRNHFPSNMTNVVHIHREEFWAFRQRESIRQIYSSPGYPMYFPNTVNENYSCAMHAKYDVLQYVIENLMYHTKYIAWVDIGYFRENEQRTFKLLPPRDLRNGHIGFTQIDPFYDYLTPKDVIYGNNIWIGGGFFIGQPQYIISFIQDYQNVVKFLLSEGLINTDQQVLYAMYLSADQFKPRLPLQLYFHICRCQHWFYIGEVCRDSYDSLQRRFERLTKFYFQHM